MLFGFSLDGIAPSVGVYRFFSEVGHLFLVKHQHLGRKGINSLPIDQGMSEKAPEGDRNERKKKEYRRKD
jgi:hypothetical protein